MLDWGIKIGTESLYWAFLKDFFPPSTVTSLKTIEKHPCHYFIAAVAIWLYKCNINKGTSRVSPKQDEKVWRNCREN